MAARLHTAITAEITEKTIANAWQKVMKALSRFESFSKHSKRCTAALSVLYNQVPQQYQHQQHRLNLHHSGEQQEQQEQQARFYMPHQVPHQGTTLQSVHYDGEISDRHAVDLPRLDEVNPLAGSNGGQSYPLSISEHLTSSALICLKRCNV